MKELHATHGAALDLGSGAVQDAAILSENVSDGAHARTVRVHCLAIISGSG